MYDDISLKEHQEFLDEIKRNKIFVKVVRILILLGFVLLWEVSAYFGWINSFIASSPSLVGKTIIKMIGDGSLYNHLLITCLETASGFFLGTLVGTLIAMLLWWFPTVAKVLDPYLVVLNSLPKVALGPIIIVWAGAGITSIMIMTLSISLITTIIGVYSGFSQVEEEKVILVRTFGASKRQIFSKVILPSSIPSIVNALKINVGLSWVGVIMGEFLVSKAGLGYLIVYGSQVFNLNLVMAGVIVLAFASGLMYFMVSYFEKIINKTTF